MSINAEWGGGGGGGSIDLREMITAETVVKRIFSQAVMNGRVSLDRSR